MSELKTIYQNIIATPHTTSNKQASRSKAQLRHKKTSDIRRSPRAQVNVIPDDKLLAILVGQAVHALKRGVYWDRGAIINLLL